MTVNGTTDTEADVTGSSTTVFISSATGTETAIYVNPSLLPSYFLCIRHKCRRHYVFGLSVCPSVRPSVLPDVCERDNSKTSGWNLLKIG